MYNIKACHCKFSEKSGFISEIIVLYDVNALDNPYIDIRATKWTLIDNKPGCGYLYLEDDEQVLSNELLQRIAGQCWQIPIADMKKIFAKEVKEIRTQHEKYLKANPHLR